MPDRIYKTVNLSEEAWALLNYAHKITGEPMKALADDAVTTHIKRNKPLMKKIEAYKALVGDIEEE